jgi:hypothetical protein
MNQKIKLLFKLLKQNISVWQLCGFVVANLLGGIIVLLGIQAYQDFDRFMNKEHGLLNESYMVISKPVSNLTTLSNFLGLQPTFTEREIKRLEEHPSVAQVGRFNAATFGLRGSFRLADIGISTDLFFESVPTEFLDVTFDNPNVWDADLNSTTVPIIISRRYLNLYNYVYAQTKGLPQISEGLTSKFPLAISISGKGMSAHYKAKIVGYTDRLNTILVPEKFLQQANEKYGTTTKKLPSRLILETKAGKGDSTLLDYLKKNGYKVEGDSETLRLQALVHGILWVVIGIGGIVSLLAFFLLMISIQLLIEKNKEKFVNLFSLGYSIRKISAPYLLLVGCIDALVWGFAAGVVSLVYPFLFDFISVISPDLQLASLFPLWGFAIGIAVVFILLHRWMILRQVRSICR